MSLFLRLYTGLMTVESIAGQVRSAARLSARGRGSREGWRLPSGAPPLSLEELRGIVDYSPADQVVTVFAGTRVRDLQEDLGRQGQCLPLGRCGPHEADLGTVGGAISMNLPHALEGTFGSWRDWVLGMRVLLADGTVAKCGSRAVKNVAGYDVQKLFIGARGTLGIIVEVTLRTTPAAAAPDPAARAALSTSFVAAHRVRRSDLPALVGSIEGPFEVDEEGATVWYNLPRDRDPVRFEGDCLFRSHCGERNLQIEDPTTIRLMKRAKEIFDPGGKLNPGEMGIF